MNKSAKFFLAFVFVLIVVIGLMNNLTPTVGQSGQPTDLDVSTLVKEARAGNVATASWQTNVIEGTFVDGRRFRATAMNLESAASSDLQNILRDNTKLEIKEPPISNVLVPMIGMLGLPILIIAIIYFFVLRPAQMGGNQAMSFGRSKAKRVNENSPKVTFEDVAGIDEAKQELYEIVDFLKNTKKYTALGAKIPKGILLTGPPGVGKTHLARAIAGEAGVPFFHISGSDFVEMFVGVGAARVRDLFDTAKAHRPSLIFVDEIDAVGRQRGAGLGGGHDEREQTLNQLLVEMDGFDPNSGVILIAATNRPDVLDPALLRPGRFDRQIVVDVPDATGREAILKIHAKGKPLDPDINLEVIGKRTPGFTGADLANMLNEGALLAARRGHSKVQQGDLDEALDRVIAGPQRKSRVLQEKEREIIAYHEAGHALIGELLEHCDPVHKVTILPRGMSLGSTWSLPDSDRYLVSEQELLDDVTELLGGRVAEELVFDEIYTGASNDLERVTRIARAMVCDYGMSDRLGSLALGKRNNNPFLGRDYTHDERNYSEEVAKIIDDEIRAIVDKCHGRAKALITENRGKLDDVVKALLVHETLNREEFLSVLEGKTLPAKAKLDEPQGNESTPSELGTGDKTQSGVPRLEPGTV